MCSRTQVQRDWRSLEKVFHFYIYKYVLSDWDYETLEHFRIIDKQLQLLMRATFKNSNILQCCQRKSVHVLIAATANPCAVRIHKIRVCKCCNAQTSKTCWIRCCWYSLGASSTCCTRTRA